jgi:DNA-directed RNA polymerase subunit RPC12/RpoP
MEIDDNNNSLVQYSESESIEIECPHCSGLVQVYLNQLNCHIFRHGIFKKTLQQIHPHLEKEKCEELVAKDLIYGCGKPFIVIKNKDKYKSEKCGYI